ncbi:MAG: hypothetical protein K9M57_01730 [Phycisphaerae bacterium]|nr:hypothetical protein [Phycisphaerae bacterium]
MTSWKLVLPWDKWEACPTLVGVRRLGGEKVGRAVENGWFCAHGGAGLGR